MLLEVKFGRSARGRSFTSDANGLPEMTNAAVRVPILFAKKIGRIAHIPGVF